ncbi:uncharacterized protein [Heterodontus francisci]|uniref:uncharacterized protein n=1 Tax=Heterodontus francisci TaxID=7792 RepID=UPI00355C9C3E
MRYYKRHWLLKWSLFFCIFSFWDLISGQIRYSIPEELQLGAFVGNIADDLGFDLRELKARSFRIVPGHTKQYFDVNLNNGNLFVKENIDREQLCGPSVTCVLSLETVIENPFSLYDFEVEILDVNDNAPAFPKSQFRLEISEMAAPGTSNPLECAHDPDVGTNSLQSYQLFPNEYFALKVESRNGNEDMPVLVLNRPLDREKTSSHRLVLIAKDGGAPERSGTAEILIIVQDVNDNPPVFSQSVYRANLLENIPKGTVVIKLNATDLDDGSNGEIVYSFSRHTSARVRELFTVDSKTGEIRVRGNLNYEENSLFELNVQAMDKGPFAIPAYCHVVVQIVDINDNAPEVKVSTLFSPVSEDSVPGTVVALISATDKDSGQNGQVKCQVTNNLAFQLDSSSKKYLTLRTQQVLDRENVSSYEVTVLCSDSGSPPLTSKKVILVDVSDINDNAPRFPQSLYTAYVMENNAIGASIFSVTAFDPDLNQNSRLNYSIKPTQVQGESVFNFVHIQSEKGIIFSQRSFDYEKLKNFQMQVQVTDFGVPPLSSNLSVDVIVLDQNDNAPVIVHPLPEYGSTVTETVSRFAEPGYLVAKVSATDADSGQNGRLSYQILQSTDPGLFTISPETGEIWTIRGIMHKDGTKQRLVIGANDNGSPSLSTTMTIILSLTDGDTEMLSDVSSLTDDPKSSADISLYLVISLGITSSIFLIVLIILAVKVHLNRNRFAAHNDYLDTCCCFEAGNTLNGIQKASRNLEIVPNYVEAFGGDPLSQRFRYETCSTLSTAERDARYPNVYSSSACKINLMNGNEEIVRNPNCKNTVNNEFALVMKYKIYWLIKWQPLYCIFFSWDMISGLIHYSIPEELQLGAFVGNIADDLGLDVKQLGARSLRIVSGSRKQYLDVNLDNGILFVRQKIDREELCGTSLTCTISLDAVLANPLNLYHAEVEILDVNDNAPRFSKSQFRLEISEASAPGARFPLECAHDADVGTNSLGTYELLDNDYFALEVQTSSGTGKLPLLVLQRSLDREKEKVHMLALIAKDRGVPERSGTAQVLIVVGDANDNDPVFDQSLYRVSLLENTPKGTLVIKLNATDLDDGSNGDIVYSFNSHTAAEIPQLFVLDSKTGEIRAKGSLDYEENSAFEIHVQAMDKGPYPKPVYCDVLVDIVDVNDNAPKVTLTSLSSPISEDAPPGTVVALISATDKDSSENGKVKCEIAGNLPFILDLSLKNYYRLLTQRPLDRENVSQHDVTITCSDAGHPALTSNKSITVEVSDVNDNSPQFTQPLYTAYVTENNIVGTSIFQVAAFDPDVWQNSRLSYSILETRVQEELVFDYVDINAESGIIFSQQSFDYEQLKHFKIHIQAQDCGVPALTGNASINVIILDQNDNAPVFVHPIPEFGSTVMETMSRFAEPGSLVAKVSATDADAGGNGQLSYEIRQSTDPGLFTISTDTGEIWSIRRLVRKDSKKQRLFIVVTDNGTPTLSAAITIILSVVEVDREMLPDASNLSEDPGFNSDISLYLVITLAAISSIFLLVLIILAFKLHNNRTGFDAHSCVMDICCCFDPRNSLNGIQKASRSIHIAPNYVEVFGGDPLSQSYRYNTCSMLHSNKREVIFPNTCDSSKIKDRGESIGNEDNPLTSSSSKYVSSAIGEIVEMRYKIIWLLYWQLLFYILSSWDLVSGQIRYSIPEELQLGAFVGNIAADLGLDVNELSARSLRIVAGARKQYLEVNLDNGSFFVKEKIDREQLCGPSLACVLSLEAVIQNPLNLYHVEVEILDINDNAPRFPKKELRLEISEMATPGTRFPLESAHDPDVGINSVQTYQLLPNDYFTLDVQTRSGVGKFPVLVLERSLDREKQSAHRLVLIAKDGGSPERSGTAQITVQVQDANDNAPIFPQAVYRVTLLENAPKGTLVIRLNATDLDAGSNGEIQYSFSSRTAVIVPQLFSVDSKTGEIVLQGPLDYEENNVFAINVQAVDKGPLAIPVYCDVVVNIIDVNDNAPEVTLTSLSSPVSEDAPPDTVVALISAADKDSGENGQVECEIENNLPFKLDLSLKNYYRLRTQRLLDREDVSKYNVTITCRDAGNSPLTSNKTILVEISDINDNSPRFTQPSYTAYLMENNIIGTSIFQVTAYDPDLNQNARLSYSILGTQIQGALESSYVYINSENGIIYSQRSFDYEQLKSFQIQVQVQDSGIPSRTSEVLVDFIILDQNDNAPVFVHPLPQFGSTVMETVSRFAEPGYLVAKVSATDADTGRNAQLSYQIRQGTDPGLFTISTDTGEIWTTRRIVNKDSKKQRLLILVKDNGAPSLSATVTIILSIVESGTEIFSHANTMSEDPGLTSDISLYLVVSLGITSSIFLVVLIILAVKVHKRRYGFDDRSCYAETCCCFEARTSLNGIQKASRNIQIPPNYVEVFGGDPLSQSFRYETCSTLNSSKRDALFPKLCTSSTEKNYISSERTRREESPLKTMSANNRNTLNSEVKQPNADWHFAQTHRAELNSSQYLEEEGVQRDIQREVQREVQCDVQRNVPRDIQCDVPHNIQREVQREVQRDVQCDVQRVVEKDPGGPRKPRPAAIPAGRDGWTLPRTAPRMQLQMTLGPHVPGTLRSQYLLPRELHTSGARISNSSVEFSAPLIGSLHGPWAANQTRDYRGVSSSGGWRAELDAQARGEIPCSPPGHRLFTQRLHSRGHNHTLREVDN